MDKLYTPDEVAEYLGVAPVTVYRWLWSGKIKGIKLGMQWRIPQVAIDEFLTVEPPSELKEE